MMKLYAIYMCIRLYIRTIAKKTLVIRKEHILNITTILYDYITTIAEQNLIIR